MKALKGIGSERKRVEDVRFTQGAGNYIDDINLDGMLFGDFVRSPYAHARVTSLSNDISVPPTFFFPSYLNRIPRPSVKPNLPLLSSIMQINLSLTAFAPSYMREDFCSSFII